MVAKIGYEDMPYFDKEILYLNVLAQLGEYIPVEKLKTLFESLKLNENEALHVTATLSQKLYIKPVQRNGVLIGFRITERGYRELKQFKTLVMRLSEEGEVRGFTPFCGFCGGTEKLVTRLTVPCPWCGIDNSVTVCEECRRKLLEQLREKHS
ncbi:MAG: hypothetical protein NZ954_08295 [Thermofilaceae archaeon]|nr:hypothetical protein [Thermofilaceae archaeon]MDW8004907.1 hypothetical protein [Thermofilaceae archaeon]